MPEQEPAQDREQEDVPQQQDPTPDGRQRLREALFKPTRSQLVVAAVLAIVGFAVVTQVEDNAADDAYEGWREDELIEVLDGLTGTAERARDEIERLRETQLRLKSRSSARSAAIEDAQKRLQTFNILAGTIPVTGPGVRVTLTPGYEGIDLGIVLDLVQELRTAGAEAIEFNDQIRVVAQSSLGVVPGGLSLDGTELSTPYVVEAIGDPQVLQTAIELSGGPVESVRELYGASVEIDQLDAVEIESVREVDRLPNATVDPDQ